MCVCVVVSGCSVDNGNCSHLCVDSRRGHSCLCPTGISLQSDRRTCSECTPPTCSTPAAFHSHLELVYSKDFERYKQTVYVITSAMEVMVSSVLACSFVC